MDIHLYVHVDYSPNTAVLESIVQKLDQLTQRSKVMSQELDNLTAQVTASTTVQDSAMVLLQGLKSALDAAIAAGNPAALQALADSLGVESAKMAAAIVANTPAATPPPAGATQASAQRR